MKFCTKCGKEIKNQELGCEYCNQEKQTVLLNKDDILSNAAKVAMVSAILLLPGIGYLIGLILGIVFMSNEKPDYKSFGKAVLTLSIIMLVISVLCCVLGFVFSMTNDTYFYHFFKYIL